MTAAAAAGASAVPSVMVTASASGMIGGKGWCAKGDPKANGFVCSGVRSWSPGMPGCVMSEISEAPEAPLEAASSLWMANHGMAPVAAGGVTVPALGDVGAVEGSRLVSPSRYSGGCGPGGGTGEGDDGDTGCRNRVGTWRGDARWMSGGTSVGSRLWSRLCDGAARCLCEIELRGSLTGLE